jgi:hypothetical protein
MSVRILPVERHNLELSVEAVSCHSDPLRQAQAKQLKHSGLSLWFFMAAHLKRQQALDFWSSSLRITTYIYK